MNNIIEVVDATNHLEKPDFLAKTRKVKSIRSQKLWHFLMVFGPGLIVMEADNDAGAVSTYTQAGAQYGLHMLWVLMLLLPVTYFCQEMVVRLGIATGEGHASMIYKRFGKWWGRFSLFDLQLVNFLTLVSEFAAISLAFSKMGISPYISVTIFAIVLIILVTSGGYLRWERIVVFLCLLDLIWLGLAFLPKTGFLAVLQNTVVPTSPPGGYNSAAIYLIIAIVGTTVAPWQLFFQQSIVADKKLRFLDLKSARVDTFIGAVFTVVVAGCMMLIGNVLFKRHITYEDPSQMAVVLGPILGHTAKYLILMLMVNAAVLGTVAISLSSAYAWSEVAGWKHSLQTKFKEAPGFYLFYAAAVLLAAGIVLIPQAPLQVIIVGVQVLAGVILPSAIIFLQILLNDKVLLGDRFVNKPWNNAINWVIIAVLFVLSFVLAAQIMLPNVFK
ncbi:MULTISPECIES: Nramp family divalent metal transporter [unclassified Mucilaginibacter]|uniref:Nramp family divalent metal transporter n=1 Tax=unclassified Mucilaginibacter TaxID=2617802 RepID=UPI000A4D1830|nr:MULTISPECIES: Nramp family divalent metal transporter [unclassified Mucilaginibacter]PLW89546.1 MAG: divalent metal cation transporter [Mucilaginibacter sp.]HEK19428.1 divalent metal cation transporter [Bacteroidota bacterium]